MSSVSDIKLIRTDTTLDLSQKAEKRYRTYAYLGGWSRFSFYKIWWTKYCRLQEAFLDTNDAHVMSAIFLSHSLSAITWNRQKKNDYSSYLLLNIWKSSPQKYYHVNSNHVPSSRGQCWINYQRSVESVTWRGNSTIVTQENNCETLCFASRKMTHFQIIFTFGLSDKISAPFSCLRPYHRESTGSRPITEVKPCRAGLVLGWVTAWEYPVL